MEFSSSSCTQIEPENAEKKIQDFVSSVPKVRDWSNYGGDGVLYPYKDFLFVKPALEGTLYAENQFKPQPDDIIIASFMKTGTTWLKSLAFTIVNRSKFELDPTHPILNKLVHDCIPFIEYDLARDSSNRDRAFPLLSTHIPYICLPKSVIDSDCKFVYIWRDPKDVFISMWYFVTKIGLNPDPIEKAFEEFCKGIGVYGPYWDHVLSYWKVKQKNPDKILFLKYEELKKDTSFYVKNLAEFLDYPFSCEEEENGTVQKIIEMCSFEKLSNLEVNKSGKHRENTPLEIQNNVYFRNGKTGDWKNHFPLEMGARLDRIFEEKLSGSGLKLTSST